MSVHRVVVTRSGGFAGIRVSAEVDDPDEATRLEAAVRESVDRPANARARDAFVYEFVIVTSTTTETVELPASQLSPDLKALLFRR